MRITIKIDDALYEQALRLTDPGVGKSELIRRCLLSFIQMQSARRLAALGGIVPDMELVQRGRDGDLLAD